MAGSLGRECPYLVHYRTYYLSHFCCVGGSFLLNLDYCRTNNLPSCIQQFIHFYDDSIFSFKNFRWYFVGHALQVSFPVSRKECDSSDSKGCQDQIKHQLYTNSGTLTLIFGCFLLACDNSICGGFGVFFLGFAGLSLGIVPFLSFSRHFLRLLKKCNKQL